MSRPVIGITSYQEQARWGNWDREAVLVPASYVRHVADTGAIPVLLPPYGFGAEVVDRLDGLVLTGGGDIDPARYGAARDPHTQAAQPLRDEAELSLLEAAITRGLPVLAICRGLQVLNVVRGGTLHQHLPNLPGVTGHTGAPGTFGSHPITVEAQSRLGRAVGTHLTVPTSHHQGIDRPGAGLRVVARADDGTIEAVELDGEAFVVGVQCHPEADADPRLFQAFREAVEAARGRA